MSADALGEATVALRRVVNENELPKHVIRAVSACIDLLELYGKKTGSRHLRAVDSEPEKVGAV